MGLFKSMRDLKKQSDEIQKNWDVGSQLENAQTQMAAANQMMADMTADANAAANAAANGIDATATIAGIRQQTAMVNYQPVVEVDLTVMPDGLPPYPATVKQVVPQLQPAQARVGATVRVKVDPDDPASVWIDWSRPA
ncbi:MAG TPA: DUF3592 domain-containing protein [Acidimicrobiia bacterium]